MPALLGIKRVPSQSTFTRFFQGFTSAEKNLACFRPLFGRSVENLPGKSEGYAMDLDSTRSTRTAIRRASRSVTLGSPPNPACIRCSRSSPRCASSPLLGYAPAIAVVQTTSSASSSTCGTISPRTCGGAWCAPIPASRRWAFSRFRTTGTKTNNWKKCGGVKAKIVQK